MKAAAGAAFSRLLSTFAVAAPALGAATAGGLAFRDAYPLPALVAVCAVAAVLPGLVTAAPDLITGHGHERGPSRRWIRVAASVTAWLVVLPPVAWFLAAPGARTPGWWSGLPHLLDGPDLLLAGSLPVTPTPVLLLLVGTLVWWAALCAGEAAVRGTGPIATLSAPVLVLAAGASVTTRLDDWASLPAAAGLLGCGVLLLVARRGRLQQHPDSADAPDETETGTGTGTAGADRPRFALGAVATTIAAVAVAGSAVAVTPLLPALSSRAAADPRRLVPPAAAATAVTDPLSQAAAWLNAAPSPLFTVRTATPTNTRWLVLDQYDGGGWSSSARYAPAGQQVAAQTDSGVTVATGTAAETITIGALPGPWLPATPTPQSVSGALVSADPRLGVLATDDGQSAQGTTYTVVSSLADPTFGQLAAAAPGSGPDLAADLAVPGGLPSAVAALGQTAMLGAAYPYQQLVKLQDWLRSDLAYDPHAFPAQAYGNLALVAEVTHSAGQDVFATLFAVLAREAGFPARIAIGFGPGHRVGADTYQVTTADVLVWPEVYLSGLGWTPFYPVPARQAAASGGVAQSVGEPPQQVSLDQRVAAEGHGPVGQNPANGAARVRAAPSSGSAWRVVAGVAAGIAAVAALAALTVLWLVVPRVRRARRRRRGRCDPDPRRSVVEAWQDALESVGRSVGEPLDALTAAEVGRLAGEKLTESETRDRVLRLARLSETAIFAPDSADPEFGAQDAAAAWHEADVIRRLVSRSWRTRLQRTPAR